MTFTSNNITALTSVLFVSFLPGCSPTKRAYEPISVRSAKGHRIHYPASNRRPYIKSIQTKTQEGTWLIDSGATESVIHLNKNSPLKYTRSDYPIRNYNLYGMFKSKTVSLSGFRVSSLNLPDITGLILPEKRFYKANNANGILGLSFLRENKSILYMPSKFLGWGNTTPHTKKFQAIKLSVRPGSGHLLLNCKINKQPLCFIIDTGASRSLIDYRSAKRAALSLKHTNKKISGIWGRPSKASKTAITSIHINSEQNIPPLTERFFVTDLSQIIGDLTSSGIAEPVDGIIGYEILSSNFHAIDFGRNLLLYEPSKKLSE